jgi:hypothetical protein
MRYALAALLLVACSDATELRVTVTASGVGVSAYDPLCSCERQTPPTAGQCYGFTDTRTGEPCNCSKDCVSSLRVERDGAIVATAQSSGIQGDFLGGTLVVEGCGNDVVVPLPGSVPALPTIDSVTESNGDVQVTWTSPPPVDLVEVHGGTLGGETCYVTPEPPMTTLRDVVGVAVSLTAMHVLPVIETDNGIVRTFAKTRADGSSIH